MASKMSIKLPDDINNCSSTAGLERRQAAADTGSPRSPGVGNRSPGRSPGGSPRSRHGARGLYLPRSSRFTHKRANPRGECTCTGTCYPGLPRPSLLCRAMTAIVTILLFIQMVSCGMFFCVGVPFHHRFHNYRRVISRAAAALAPGHAQPDLTSALNSRPATLIPRIIHLTGRKYVPKAAQDMVASWQRLNGPAWEVRFWDDAACQSFVHKEFPEYWEAYNSLPKDVERADFFRYMVVSRLGGVYADIDVECRQPLDALILPSDTLLVGWEQEVPASAAARPTPIAGTPSPSTDSSQLQPASAAQPVARTRQILNWFFAAAPRHPVLREMCDHIARNAMSSFSSHAVRDTMERTGLGVWTDVVLKHAIQHPAEKLQDPWKVRILPRVAFATQLHPVPPPVPPPEVAAGGGVVPQAPLSLSDLPKGSKRVLVVHHWLGQWQHMVPPAGLLGRLLGPLVRRLSRPVDPGPLPPPKDANYPLYPVSIQGLQGVAPFTLMTHLVGSGDRQGGADVSAMLTTWGAWQPGTHPLRNPSVVQALVGPLAPDWAPPGAPVRPAAAAWVRQGVLLDVGAGYGFVSLAAAAKGHEVMAVETSPRSLAALESSIEYNGLSRLLRLQQKVLGPVEGWVCLDPQQTAAEPDATAAAAGVHLEDNTTQQHASSSSSTEQQQTAAATGLRQPGGNQQQAQKQRHLSSTDIAAAKQHELHQQQPAAAAGDASSSSSSSSSSGRAALRLAAELASSLWVSSVESTPAQDALQLEQEVRLRRGYPHWADLHPGQTNTPEAAATDMGSDSSSSSAQADSTTSAGTGSRVDAAGSSGGIPARPGASSAAADTAAAAAGEATGTPLGRPPGSPGLPPGFYQSSRAAAHCKDLRPVTTLTALLGNHTRVTSMRVSAHGHEGWVLAGALPYLKAVHKPEVIALDFWPAAMRAAGYSHPQHLLWQLYQLGYKDAAHAGRVCEQRWSSLTKLLHWQPLAAAAQVYPLEPSWCKLQPEQFPLLEEDVPRDTPETLVFVLRHPTQTTMPAKTAGRSNSSIGALHSTPLVPRTMILEGNIFLKPKLATPVGFADKAAAQVALIAEAAAAEAAARQWEEAEQQEMEEEGLTPWHASWSGQQQQKQQQHTQRGVGRLASWHASQARLPQALRLQQ